MIELSIDLGSKFITIYQKGLGLVLREPCMAIAMKSKNKIEIREAGYRAESIMSGSLGGANVIYPIKEGVVVDETMAALMLEFFLKKITPKSVIKPKFRAIVSICSSSINSDRLAVEKMFIKAGIKEVTLVEAPLSLLAYSGSLGGLFVDIGGGKTEIASCTNHGIANGCSVNIAGDAFNAAIIEKLYLHYGVRLGDYTMENLKKSALSFYTNDEGTYQVSGAGKDGNPKSLLVTAAEMRDAVVPLVDDLIEVVISILNQTPPELSSEIMRKGIYVSGGSLKIPGLVEYLQNAFEIPVTVLKDPDNAIAIGGAKFFDNKNLLSDMLGVKLN